MCLDGCLDVWGERERGESGEEVWAEEGDDDFIYKLLLALGVFKRFYAFCVV